MAQQLASHLAEIEALLESKESGNGTSIDRTLNQEYKSMTLRKGGKSFQKPCKGPGLCTNLLCEHTYAITPALSQEQKRILDALKKKSTSEGYDFGDKYAKSMLQNNNWKLVATLEAIKADINTRESAIRDSGRFRILPSESLEILTPRYWMKSTSVETREGNISQIESEDNNLKLCVTQKTTSPYWKELSMMNKSPEERKRLFSSYVAEANFRVARAKYFVECKGNGLEGDELYKKMDDWENEHEHDPQFKGTLTSTRYASAKKCEAPNVTESKAKPGVLHQATVEDAGSSEDDSVGAPKEDFEDEEESESDFEPDDGSDETRLEYLAKVFESAVTDQGYAIPEEDETLFDDPSTTEDQKRFLIFSSIRRDKFPGIPCEEETVKAEFAKIKEMIVEKNQILSVERQIANGQRIGSLSEFFNICKTIMADGYNDKGHLTDILEDPTLSDKQKLYACYGSYREAMSMDSSIDDTNLWKEWESFKQRQLEQRRVEEELLGLNAGMGPHQTEDKEPSEDLLYGETKQIASINKRIDEQNKRLSNYFSTTAPQTSRPKLHPIAKYPYLRKEHSISTLEYKSPYKSGGGFVNGFQGKSTLEAEESRLHAEQQIMNDCLKKERHWLDINIEGDYPVTDEGKLGDPAWQKDQQQWKNYRRLRATNFPGLPQDNATAKREFAKIKQELKARQVAEGKTTNAIGRPILTYKEAVDILGPHATPAQTKLLYLQRSFEYWPPEKEKDIKAFMERLAGVKEDLLMEVQLARITEHDPSKFGQTIDPRKRAIIDQHLVANSRVFTQKEQLQLTDNILTVEQADKILGSDATEAQKFILFWERYLQKHPIVSEETSKAIELRLRDLTKCWQMTQSFKIMASTIPVRQYEIDAAIVFIKHAKLPGYPQRMKRIHRMTRRTLECVEARYMMDQASREQLLVELEKAELANEKNTSKKPVVPLGRSIEDLIWDVANTFHTNHSSDKSGKEPEADEARPEEHTTFDEVFDQYATAKILQTDTKTWDALTGDARACSMELVEEFELSYPEKALMKGSIIVEEAIETTPISSPRQRNSGDSSENQAPKSRSATESIDDPDTPKSRTKGMGFIKTAGVVMRKIVGPKKISDTLLKKIGTRKIDEKLKKLEIEKSDAEASKGSDMDANIVRGLMTPSTVQGAEEDDIDTEDNGFENSGDEVSADDEAIGVVRSDKESSVDKKGKAAVREGVNEDETKKKGNRIEVDASEKIGLSLKEINRIQPLEYVGANKSPKGLFQFEIQNPNQIAALVNAELDSHTLKLKPQIRTYFIYFLGVHSKCTKGDALSHGPFKQIAIFRFMEETRTRSIYTAINMLGICGKSVKLAGALYYYFTAYLEQYFASIGVASPTQQMVEVKIWEFTEYMWERRKIMLGPYIEDGRPV